MWGIRGGKQGWIYLWEDSSAVAYQETCLSATTITDDHEFLGEARWLRELGGL